MSLPASESNNWDQAVHLPDYVDREQASEVLRRLTDAGKRQFDADLRAAEAEGPERVHAVVYSWYRTAQHVDAPGFLDAVAKARAEVQTARPWAAADMEELRRLADSG